MTDTQIVDLVAEAIEWAWHCHPQSSVEAWPDGLARDLAIAALSALPDLSRLEGENERLRRENAELRERVANGIQLAGGKSPIAPQQGGFAAARTTLTKEV